MLDVDAIMRPWWDRLRADHPEVDLFDAHTHVGADDPDGVKQSPQELLAALERASARAVVFPMHEPDGYARANERVLEAAAASGGKLFAYCRVDPRADAVGEARRCLDAGARGIKLHPRAEQFTLSEPAVRELVALAHERRAPVLIHAGRGIPALGRDTVRLSGEFPDARLILAHAAISDLAWLWRVLPEHPSGAAARAARRGRLPGLGVAGAARRPRAGPGARGGGLGGGCFAGWRRRPGPGRVGRAVVWGGRRVHRVSAFGVLFCDLGGL